MFFILFTVLIFSSRHCSFLCTEKNKCINNKNMPIPFCYCDENCLSYKDCCKEYISSHLPTTKSSKEDPSLQNEKCIILTDSADSLSFQVGAYMVDTCLVTDKNCQIKEGDLETMVPVSFGNTTYRNADCAICNDELNFEFWDIVYNIPNEDDVFSVSSDEKTINDDNVLQVLQHGNLSGREYFFHPPTNYIPRYCPYDVVSRPKGNESVDAILTHQKVVECEGSLYKNVEICEIYGCCLTKPISCMTYVLPFSTAMHNTLQSRGKVEGGIRVLIQFKTRITSDSKKVVTTGIPKLTYMNNAVPIFIKIQQLTNDSFSLRECVHGLICYLHYTKFNLFPQHAEYIHTTDERNMHSVFIPFREGAKLKEAEVNYLLRLKQVIYFDKRPNGIVATGELEALNTNRSVLTYFSNSLDGLNMGSIRKSLIRQLSKKTYPTCNNMSIIFQSEKSKVGVLDAKCMGNGLNQISMYPKSEVVLTLLLFALVQIQLAMMYM